MAAVQVNTTAAIQVNTTAAVQVNTTATAVVQTPRSALYVSRIDLSAEEALYLDQLTVPRHHSIMVWNRQCHPARNTQFYSDEAQSYGFSGSEAKALPLSPELKQIMNRVNVMFKDEYNGILVNIYCSGMDNIGAHSDDESQLGRSGVVMMVRGQVRKFRIRDKATKKIVKDVDMLNNTLAWMSGDFQKEFTHEIPVEKRRNGRRLSLTFRKHL
jgi:alkylated DNA repair dioxygenase AlkB